MASGLGMLAEKAGRVAETGLTGHTRWGPSVWTQTGYGRGEWGGRDVEAIVEEGRMNLTP